MLSRLVSRAVLQSQPMGPRPMFVAVQKASSVPAPQDAKEVTNEHLEDPLDSVPRVFPKKTEGPERDLVNFPRPVQREHCAPVRLAFIPEEWFDFFHKKTGVSGPYMFLGGTLTFLLSKEIYVLEHNFYNGLSLLIIVAILHNKFGPKIAESLDKKVDQWVVETKESEEAAKIDLKKEIEAINEYLSDIEVYKDVCEARRETAAAALEVTYREWMKQAHDEAKRRLDYQVELANVERRISQRNMSSWITNSVLKAITPAQEQETLKKCIQDLKSLSATA